MQEAGAPQPRPVHVLRLQPAQRRVAPIIQDADRAGRHPVLEEVEAHPGPLGPEHSRAVDAMARELTHRTVRPGMRSRKRRDERRAQAAATLASEPPICTSRETACSSRWGGGAASRSMTSPSETRSKPMAGGQAVETSRMVKELPSIKDERTDSMWRA